MKHYLSNLILATGLASTTLFSGAVQAKSADSLNVIVTSADHQTQLMAMVLSMQTIKAHNKKVDMVLCGPAGALSLKETKTPKMKPRDVSPTMLLKKIISMGANVGVCPLYLPNAGKDKSDMIEGIKVVKPPKVAGRLLDKNSQSLSF